jgi:hypothetical protein
MSRPWLPDMTGNISSDTSSWDTLNQTSSMSNVLEDLAELPLDVRDGNGLFDIRYVLSLIHYDLA